MSAFISTLPSAVIPTVSMPPICHVSDAIQRDGSVCVSVYCFLSSQGGYYVVHVGKVIRFNEDSIIDPHTLYLLSYHYERLYRKTYTVMKSSAVVTFCVKIAVNSASSSFLPPHSLHSKSPIIVVNLGLTLILSHCVKTDYYPN